MVNGWRTVPFAEILTLISNPEPVDRDKTYRILGMRWYARGLFIREDKPGYLIQAKELFRVEKDDFVYNRLFAWKGSFGIVDDSTAGGYVSGEFPCFHVVTKKADPKFIHLYLSQEPIWDEIGRISSGQTNISRLRLKVPDFLRMKIPLPPLEEQRRIVERIEALAGRVSEAQRLRREAENNVSALIVEMAHRKDLTEEKRISNGWENIYLGEIISQRKDRFTVDTNKVYPNLGVFSFGRGLFKKPPIEGFNTSAKELYKVHSGQFIYSRLFAFEGACGWVTDEYDGCFVSAEFPNFDCDLSRVRPEFLFAYFKDLNVWKQIAAGSKGLGDRRQRVQPDTFLNFRIMLPPIEWQNKLSRVINQANELESLQAETQKELDALMPSILDRAFKGEL